MNFLRLTALLVYTFGAFAYGAIFVLWLRQLGRAGWAAQPRPAGPLPGRIDLASGALTFVSFAWFVVSLLLTLIPLNPDLPVLPLEIAANILVFLFPPLIMHCTYMEPRDKGELQKPRLWKLTLLGTYVGSQSVSLLIILAIFDIVPLQLAGVRMTAGIAIAFFFTVAGIYSAALTSKVRRKTESAEERSSRRSMLVLFVLLALLFLPVTFANMGWFRLAAFYEVALRSLPLAFLFVGTYFYNRFEFFDVFIKRGLSLLVTIVALTAYFAWVLPWLEGFRLEWARPWVYAVVLLPAALALPWMYRYLGKWLDSFWLGRKFTTVEAVKHVLSSLHSATSQKELVDKASRGISDIFNAPVRIDLELREARNPASSFELEIPVRRSTGPGGVIQMGRRVNHTPYFSEDVALLSSLADVFAHLLDNMHLQEKKQEQEKAAKELVLQASRSELKALRAQINPHFLFNALNAIAGLIHKDPVRADRTVEQLAEVFRYTLRRSESEWIQLEHELEFVGAYLEVEQARFGTRLEFDIRAEPEARAVRIPTMMLQTLVENAVKHGVAEVRGAGRIEIDARLQDDHLRIEVADNGPGFEQSESLSSPRLSGRSTGYGLSNIRQRLEGYFGEAARLQIDRDASRGMTVVRMFIPLLGEPSEAGTRETAESGGSGSR